MSPRFRSQPSRFLSAAAFSLVAALPAAAFADSYAVETVDPAEGLYVPAPEKGVTVHIGKRAVNAGRIVDLPFEFPYFGEIRTQVTICSNGWFAFGQQSARLSRNEAIPASAAPNALVAPLWDALTTGKRGAVRSFTTGTAPNRVFVIEWTRMDTADGDSAADVSFQALLHETSGVIEFAYLRDDASRWNGLSFTAGIENDDGSTGFGGPNTLPTNSAEPAADVRFVPQVISVHGAVTRDRPVAGTTGLGVTTETGLPVAGADLELRDHASGRIRARGRTRADGTWTIGVVGAEDGGTFDVRIASSGAESFVTSGSGGVYSFAIHSDVPFADGADAGTFSFTTAADGVDPSFRPALNIQQASRRGLAYAQRIADLSPDGSADGAETIPRLEFRYVRNTAASGNATNYAPGSSPRVNVHDATDNPDAYDDDVILRECGLHVLASLSTSSGAPTPRSFTNPISAERAWSDGFATWFACVVQGRTQFIDTKSAVAADVFDLEAATPAPQKRTDVTGAVATGLWDLVDPANEARDAFAGTGGVSTDPELTSTSADILRVIDVELDAPATAVTTAAFFARFLPTRSDAGDGAAASRALIATGALTDDTREANDSDEEVSDLGAGARQVTGLVLNAGNEDWFSVDFSESENPSLEVTVTPVGTPAQYDLFVLTPEGGDPVEGVRDFASGRTTATVPSGASGVYRIRIVWTGGSAMNYTVTAREETSLGIDVLPAATADRRYTYQLDATGGVTPYTYRITQRVPGLGYNTNAAQIEGTPSLPGDFTVRVRTQDASGIGDGTITDLPLRVNRPLRLAAFAGAMRGSAFDVVVGSGGTAPVWTAGNADEGYTLTDGAELRVTGAAPASGSVVVSGTASESNGATVTTGASRVVVCDPMPSDAAASVPSTEWFGFAFDGATGASASFTFSFRGMGNTPDLVAICDEQGGVIGGEDAPLALHDGRAVRLRATTLVGNGRHFAIFRQKPDAADRFTGTVRASGGVRPPEGVHGVVALEARDEGTDVVPVYVTLLAGTKVRVVLRSEQVPTPVLPDIVGFALADGSGEDILAGFSSSRGGKVVSTGYMTVPATGLYRLLIGANTSDSAVRTGPISFRIDVR